MLCLACGCDLSAKSDDGRWLDTPQATKVVALWKHLALLDDSYSESELERLLVGNGRPEDQGKMCWKCFSAYQLLIEVADTQSYPQVALMVGLAQPSSSTCTSPIVVNFNFTIILLCL